jgi:hypothetical protein
MDKEYSVTIDGEAVNFEFKDSLIHAEGEHAGNIDAIITTKPPLPQNLLLDELHIKVPGTDDYLYIYGYGVVENSLKATFNSSALVDTQKLPEMVGVYWGANGEILIGEMSCQPYSETIEHELADELDEIDESNELHKNNESKSDNSNRKEKDVVSAIATTNKKNTLKVAVTAILVLIALYIIYFFVV